MNSSFFIQPNSYKIYVQRNINLKNWFLFCMDIQKEQDSDAHGSS